MHPNKKWVPYESTTPNFERKTWEIKNVLVAALIFKKSWSLWTKAWLASSLLEQKLIPSNWPIIFVQPQQQLNPKKLGGKHDQKPQHNPKGNCFTEWSQFLFCSKRKKSKATPAWSCLQKFLDFFNLFQFLSVIWLKMPQDFLCQMSLSC